MSPLDDEAPPSAHGPPATSAALAERLMRLAGGVRSLGSLITALKGLP